MRITRQALLKIANDTAEQQVRQNRKLIAAYLCGSLSDETRDPVLGGTADIDLVFVHEFDPPTSREIIRLTPEVHIDIQHHERALYRQARQLRTDLVLGSAIYGCKILHDPRHLLDFAQASIRAHFHRADNILARVRPALEAARQAWFKYQFSVPEVPTLSDITAYLEAVNNTANAVAALSGDPLTTRRLLLDFPARAEAAGQPGLYPGLLGLLGAPKADAATLRTWLPVWESAFSAAAATANHPANLHEHRLPYYQTAMETMLETTAPQNILWPLLITWTQAVTCLPDTSSEFAAWHAALTHLQLAGGGFADRIAALDTYLDAVEEIVDRWAQKQGLIYE